METSGERRCFLFKISLLKMACVQPRLFDLTYILSLAVLL